MIDRRRLELALVAGLVPLLILGALAAVSPRGALGLAGQPGSPGFRLAASSLRIDGMGLYSRSVAGHNVAHFDIGRLNQSLNMVMERDFYAGSLVAGGGVYTVRVAVPVAVAADVNIYTTRACVRGVGVAGFGFLNGLLDGFLNSALSSGLRPSLLTMLLNLIGPSGLLDFNVARMWGETVRLDTARLAAGRGVAISVTRQTTSPQFVGGCL